MNRAVKDCDRRARVSLRLPPELHKKMKLYSQKNRYSCTAVIEMALQTFFKGKKNVSKA